MFDLLLYFRKPAYPAVYPAQWYRTITLCPAQVHGWRLGSLLAASVNQENRIFPILSPLSSSKAIYQQTFPEFITKLNHHLL